MPSSPKNREKNTLVNEAFNDMKTRANSNSQFLQSPAVMNRAIELGIDPNEDKEYLWIAVKSLQSKLPNGWLECKTDEGYTYYWNENTEESIWTNPLLPFFSELFQKIKYETINDNSNNDENDPNINHKNIDIDDLRETWNNLPDTPNTLITKSKKGTPTPTPTPPSTRRNRDKTDNIPPPGGATPQHILTSPSDVGGLVSPDLYPISNTKTLPAVESIVRNDLFNREDEGEKGENNEDNKVENLDKEEEAYNDNDDARDLLSPNTQRYSHVESARAALSKQNRDLEDNLQKAVLEIATMHDNHFRSRKTLREQLERIESVCSTGADFLENHGYERPILLNPDELLPEQVAEDVESTLYALKAAFSESGENGGPDDAGYQRNMEGVLLRLRAELQHCFTEHGPILRSEGIDASALGSKLNSIVGILTSFGEYLAPETRFSTYGKPLLDHIIASAPGSTLVPLEVVASVGGIVTNSSIYDNDETKSNTVNKSTIAAVAGLHPPSEAGIDQFGQGLPAPSRIASIVEELEISRSKVLKLQDTIEEGAHEREVLAARLSGAEARLADALAREEALFNKFSILAQGMDDIKAAQISGVAVDGSSGVDPKTISVLHEKIAAYEKELMVASKRAAESERRLEIGREEIAEKEGQFRTKEVQLQLELDERAAVNAELIDSRKEVEEVSRELYEELQTALQMTRNLSNEKEHLKGELSKAKGRGDYSAEQLAVSLEMEKNRVKTVELTVEELRREADARSAELTAAEVQIKESKIRADEANERLTRHIDDLNRARKRNETLANENQALMKRSDLIRKQSLRLMDKLVDVQGNVRVFCRVKRMLESELKQKNLRQYEVNAQVRHPDVTLLEYAGAGIYEFDRVFDGKVLQGDIYDEIHPSIEPVMNGGRVLLLFYGISGTGKSFSMLGPDVASDHESKAISTNNTMSMNHSDSLQGLLPRALADIYTEAERDALAEVDVEVNISIVDIYNERVLDLLGKNAVDDDSDVDLKVGLDGEVYVEGLKKRPVHDVQEVMGVIGTALHTRRVASGDDNERMNKSHLIIMFTITRFDNHTGQRSVGHLYFTELAGSEKLKATSGQAHRLREAQIVNRSLKTLGEVIREVGSLPNNNTKSNSDSNNATRHIPYRNCKLTFLLQNMLNRGSRITLVSCIDPIPLHANDNIETLRFASQCREYQMGALTTKAEYEPASVNLALDVQKQQSYHNNNRTMMTNASGSGGGMGRSMFH